MVQMMLFPLAEYWWFYGAFTFFVLGMLALDLGVFHRSAHEVSFREATFWSVLWVSLALGFCLLLYLYCDWKFALDPRLRGLPGAISGELARQTALEFLTGFLTEKVLSLDNIFVFYLVFNFFAVPARYQHRVLFFGILGALFFRVIFIALGAVLLQYRGIVLLFGVLLMFTGLKILFGPAGTPNLENNFAVRALRRFLPISNIDGHRFFSRVAGRLHATPLLMALIAAELSDIVFAVDSVPAIFAVTREPLLVFTSNVFAILGLRAMYSFIAAAAPHFNLLKFALALILIFVGLKMAWLNEAFGGKFPIVWSLGIILLILVIGIGASVLGSRKAGSQKNRALEREGETE